MHTLIHYLVTFSFNNDTLKEANNKEEDKHNYCLSLQIIQKKMLNLLIHWIFIHLRCAKPTNLLNCLVSVSPSNTQTQACSTNTGATDVPIHFFLPDAEYRSDASALKKTESSSMHLEGSLFCFPHNPKTIQFNPVHCHKSLGLGFIVDP